MALDTALSIVLSPLLLAQTAWMLVRAERLPEPDGPRAGQTGTGRPLRFLQIGDSSAVGVGVDTQEQALAPQLAAQLGQHFSVAWTVCGENGATTADAPRLLAPLSGQRFDVAFAIFGINDTKNLRRVAAWRHDYTALLERLRTAHGVRITFVSGLPPVQDFALIPHPLRTVLALRTRRFDRVLQQVVAARPDCVHVPLPPGLDPTGMARDGLHPGPAMYTDWARGAAEAMLPYLQRAELPAP